MNRRGFFTFLLGIPAGLALSRAGGISPFEIAARQGVEVRINNPGIRMEVHGAGGGYGGGGSQHWGDGRQVVNIVLDRVGEGLAAGDFDGAMRTQ